MALPKTQENTFFLKVTDEMFNWSLLNSHQAKVETFTRPAGVINDKSLSTSRPWCWWCQVARWKLRPLFISKFYSIWIQEDFSIDYLTPSMIMSTEQLEWSLIMTPEFVQIHFCHGNCHSSGGAYGHFSNILTCKSRPTNKFYW